MPPHANMSITHFVMAAQKLTDTGIACLAGRMKAAGGKCGCPSGFTRQEKKQTLKKTFLI